MMTSMCVVRAKNVFRAFWFLAFLLAWWCDGDGWHDLIRCRLIVLAGHTDEDASHWLR